MIPLYLAPNAIFLQEPPAGLPKNLLAKPLSVQVRPVRPHVRANALEGKSSRTHVHGFPELQHHVDVRTASLACLHGCRIKQEAPPLLLLADPIFESVPYRLCALEPVISQEKSNAADPEDSVARCAEGTDAHLSLHQRGVGGCPAVLLRRGGLLFFGGLV